MEKEIDEVILCLILVMIVIVDSLTELLSIVQKGVMKDPKTELLKKTNKELRQMLGDQKKISQLNKSQLVDMVISYS